MAFNKKLTLLRGAPRETIVVAAGTDIVGTTDGIEVNIEQTLMTAAEASDMLRKIADKIIAGPWPL